MGARSGGRKTRTHVAYLGMGRSGRGHREIPVARRRSQRGDRARGRLHRGPTLHRRRSDVHRTGQHHHLLAVRAARLRPRRKHRGIIQALRRLAGSGVERTWPRRTLLRTQRHRHAIRQTRRSRTTPIHTSRGRSRRHTAPRDPRLRFRRGKNGACVEHLTRENVGQSGEISGKTSRSNALADGHES